jgi:membrane associated rhomboid family serine protease
MPAEVNARVPISSSDDVIFWAFGPEIEDAMGPLPYLVFYLLSGVVAFLAQVAAIPHATVPNLGASGAIAGVMGAFLITYPSDEIRTLVLFGIFVRITFISAALLIGVWFIIQLFNQVGSVADVVASLTSLMWAAASLERSRLAPLSVLCAATNGEPSHVA